MADDFNRSSWERRWSQVLRDHPEMLAEKPPNRMLVAEAGGLTPGRALDAGCGHGAETIWLASQGWTVTAVDFSAAALDHGRTTAAALGRELSDRIDWVEADLDSWAPTPRAYDLVSCLYVHVAGDIPETVARLGSGVAPGGTLLMTGHLPVDPETGEPTRAAGQTQVTVDGALAALGVGWQVEVAEERRREDGSGADAVVHAVRL
ncbi:class I SAM-dependent methyltransferase [Nocardioides sp. MH1]|uniref:class I SAM-dependent methyltransferase n=1 Tax=Nocardioides sp. MH1 TaxID=3242490 RepID=UPI0035217206